MGIKCQDCIHCTPKEGAETELERWDEAICVHPESDHRNQVNVKLHLGEDLPEPKFCSCSDMRQMHVFCGPDAKYFEKIKEVKLNE